VTSLMSREIQQLEFVPRYLHKTLDRWFELSWQMSVYVGRDLQIDFGFEEEVIPARSRIFTTTRMRTITWENTRRLYPTTQILSLCSPLQELEPGPDEESAYSPNSEPPEELQEIE